MAKIVGGNGGIISLVGRLAWAGPRDTSNGPVLSARIGLLMAGRSIAVFDLGGVLVDWDPRYLYRKLFDGESEAMEEFLATVCTQSWNEEQDAGRPFAEGCAALKQVHPHAAELIDAWFARYDEMLAGPIAEQLVCGNLSCGAEAVCVFEVVPGSYAFWRGETVEAGCADFQAFSGDFCN